MKDVVCVYVDYILVVSGFNGIVMLPVCGWRGAARANRLHPAKVHSLRADVHLHTHTHTHTHSFITDIIGSLSHP
jgi:hypothetical protein